MSHGPANQWAGGRLAKLLKGMRGDMSLRDMAKVTGLSPATLSRMERGYKPDVDALAHLCHCYAWSADRIMLG